jgi:lycopene cyclase domain-containing protein
MTAVFDNFIVVSGVVAYDPALLSGVFIGFAPIEDFAYTLVAALLIPLTWWWLGSRVKK